jgi:hypothetical protein
MVASRDRNSGCVLGDEKVRAVVVVLAVVVGAVAGGAAASSLKKDASRQSLGAGCFGS